MWGWISLRFKITLLVVSIVATASAVFSKFTYTNIQELLSKSAGLGAETAAQALADSIDPFWLRDWNLDRDLNTSEYNRVMKRLAVPVNRGTIALVSVVQVNHTTRKVLHVAALPMDESADYYPPGTVEAFEDSLFYTMKVPGYLATSELPRPGIFMVGWAPIAHNGETVGLVLVAVDVSDIKANLETISLAIQVSMFILVLLAGLLAFKTASAFEKTAVTDGLMGIYNHKYFKQRLEEEVSKSKRYGQQTSMVLLDIDFFKRVNDTYGHATGDIVLKNLARWVTETCRNTDVTARYGGEEIAIILPHTTLAGAQEFAERLRIKVSQQIVCDPEEDAQFRITISVGVAQWERGVTAIDLIKRADVALYHSKHTGRNRVSIYQDDIMPAPPDSALAGKS